MHPLHSPWMCLALALVGCTTSNPPYDAGEDVVGPDAARPCDPEHCPTGLCFNGRCVRPCTDAGACPSGQTCCEDTFCADLSSDPQNCGACGITCGPEQLCKGMTCSDVVL